MITKPIEWLIRGNFKGRSNAGLRAEIRRVIEEDQSVMAIAQRVALTPMGHAALVEIYVAVGNLVNEQIRSGERCADCREPGHSRGFQACQYPQEHAQ